MNDFRDRLLFIRDNQNRLMKEYEALIDAYESNDIIHDNVKLRQQYEDYKFRWTELQAKYKQKEEENVKLRASLMERMLDEKLSILAASHEKLDTYFAAQSAAHSNRLHTFEQQATHDIDHLFREASSRLNGQQTEIIQKLEQLSADLNQKIAAHRKRMAEEEMRVQARVGHGLQSLAAEGISEETAERRIKQNQIEMKIGLNWINKLGILLIVIGVGAAFKYSYSTWFSGHMKGLAFFLLAALMLAGGEWFFHKNRQTFALGLLGGGISVFYGSIFYSYFLLDIINIYVSFALSVIVTAGAVLLSLRYRSRTICSLGLVGGYFPFFSYVGTFGLDGSAVYAAMGYLFLLNLLILLVSLRQRWVVVNYISFLFHAPSMVALVLLAHSEAAGMLYSALIFVMYLGITLYYPMKHQTRLSGWDVTLLALSTATSCGMLHVLFGKAGLEDFRGLLALIFCMVYFGLGRAAQRVIPQEKPTRVLFYATSLTFAVLMIPFQFSSSWLSTGWLVEGVLLIIYGGLYRYKQLERGGWGILLLCLLAFYLWDIPTELLRYYDNVNFNVKFSSIVLGTLGVSVFYALRAKQTAESHTVTAASNSLTELRVITVFKYFSVVNAWFYLLYEGGRLYNAAVPVGFSHYDFYERLYMAFVSIALAYTLSKTRVLYDRVVKYYCAFLYAMSYLICQYMTLNIPTLEPRYSYNTAANYIALALLLGFNVYVCFSGRRLLMAFLRRHRQSLEMYPILMGVYLFAIVTVFIDVQLRMGAMKLLFSLTYLFLAIGYIMYGFRKHYIYIRRLGLAITLFATGKLFLYDLSYLSTSSKIMAYFCFGLVLLGISFVYQKVSARLDETHDTQRKTDAKG
ncbi:DUF2339 domain-containing protein [Paenibacillus xerothermodurans]|uniref:DUF2339 domain-containing protein n=1 Tax=Paenibacillus xerothermodurans TaxID=1977292 RepID=A0A2W1N476_PAEXE|nr:DUF2339 domain-containing protein [Paenibacillus xerothermodurans]PZE19559.1 DUF2339 domain-containing protein [Paenibacillus xerothermodurans]